MSSKFQEYIINGIDEWKQNNISFIEKPELKLKDLIKVDGDDGCSKLVHKDYKDYLNMDLNCFQKYNCCIKCMVWGLKGCQFGISL